eukprot:TRINITY_DN49614_c0_g1_i1.p1 TRINITY_DN49614_c0_g1~~TRINITY_DN49614_c0_g1_i1.p1  ORF type:complete len:280 (+),score=45.06 TRINITY_DN49614_c0_g1_i1:66-905(+)
MWSTSMAKSYPLCCPVLSGRSYQLCLDLGKEELFLPSVDRQTSLGDETVSARSGCLSRQTTDDEFSLAGVSQEALLEALEDCLASCNFDSAMDDCCAITIAHAKHEESMTFEAVSAGFEWLSGYSRHELLGKSLRLLTHSCLEDLRDRMARSLSDTTGAATVTDICIQTKTLEWKACRVAHRGLSLAFDPEQGERLWVLLSVYVDLSDFEDADADISGMLENMLENIRNKISNAIAGLCTMLIDRKRQIAQGHWHLLPPCPWYVAALAAGPSAVLEVCV